MNAKFVNWFVPTMSSPADATRLLFMGLVGLLLSAGPTSGLTITWGADTPDSVQLPQCEDLTFTFSGTNSLVLFRTKKKFKRCNFDRSLRMLSAKNNGAYTITGSSMGHKRGREYFGSDFLDLCDQQNMKMQLEIIPSFTAHMDTTCVPVEGRRPIAGIDVGSIGRCEKACIKKGDCLGFEFNPGASNDCMLFDYAPEPLINMTTSATPSDNTCVPVGGICEVDEAGDFISECCSPDNACVDSRCIATDPPTMKPTGMPSEPPSSMPSPEPSMKPSASPSSAPTPYPSSTPSSCVAAGSACTLDEGGNPIEPCCSEGHVCMMIGSSTRCVTSDPPTMMPTSTPTTPPPLPSPTALIQSLEQGTSAPTASPDELRSLRVRRPIHRALQQESIPGAACYAGLSTCPEPPAPHCSIDAEVTCAVANDTSIECDDAASLLPSNVTAGDEACNIRLVYTSRAIIQTRTIFPDISKVTHAMRTRKGGEPVGFARPREYDWLANDKLLLEIPGAGTLPFMSEEEVIVDFCSKKKYKTLAEFVVNTQPKTICTGRDQYTLDVAGL